MTRGRRWTPDFGEECLPSLQWDEQRVATDHSKVLYLMATSFVQAGRQRYAKESSFMPIVRSETQGVGRHDHGSEDSRDDRRESLAAMRELLPALNVASPGSILSRENRL